MAKRVPPVRPRQHETVGNILVVGDVTLDWLEETVSRAEREEHEEQRNYKLYNPGFEWTPVWGGAALLQRLVNEAVRKRRSAKFSVLKTDVPLARHAVFKTVKIPDLNDQRTRYFVQSLAMVKAMKAEDGRSSQKADSTETPIRVAQFKGFSSGPNPIILALPDPNTVKPLACLVLDDAANGCRWDPTFSAGIQKLAHQAAYTIVKLSRPLDSEYLLKILPHGDSSKRIVLIINADDLRSQGVDISRRLSWERSAADIMAASRDTPILEKLCRLGDVVIRLGNDGCVMLLADGKRYLVFDPRGAEYSYDDGLVGTMPGATSAFVASLTGHLVFDGSISPVAICNALAASRNLLERGFERRTLKLPTGKKRSDAYRTLAPLDYPLDVFDLKKAKNFAAIELPPNINAGDSWSILQIRLRNDKSAARRIASVGAIQALGNVPVTEYGKLLLVDRREIEGYRSIENLLREYIRTMQFGKKPRPLSIGVFGPPGSGKSFGVKQIAASIKGQEVKSHTFNLTQFEGPRDLIGAFHIARDEALQGCLPLLVFDEFDCAFQKEPWGWLKYFLVPMQDGEFKDERQPHPLGHAIFVFAGGIAHSYSDFTNLKTPEQQVVFEGAKGPDFASRLRGYVDVQGINSATVGDLVCTARRAVLLRSLLLDQGTRTENLFPVINGNKRLQIDESVLDALLGDTDYRHGARSLEALLLMSRLSSSDHFSVASLPADAQLLLHVDRRFIDALKRQRS